MTGHEAIDSRLTHAWQTYNICLTLPWWAVLCLLKVTMRSNSRNCLHRNVRRGHWGWCVLVKYYQQYLWDNSGVAFSRRGRSQLDDARTFLFHVSLLFSQILSPLYVCFLLRCSWTPNWSLPGLLFWTYLFPHNSCTSLYQSDLWYNLEPFYSILKIQSDMTTVSFCFFFTLWEIFGAAWYTDIYCKVFTIGIYNSRVKMCLEEPQESVPESWCFEEKSLIRKLFAHTGN